MTLKGTFGKLKVFINFTAMIQNKFSMKKCLYYLTAVVALTATLTACTADITTLPMDVTLSHSSVTMIPGETLTLIPDITPDEATIKTVTWSSSNLDVATVTDGVVTAIAEGAAFVTATTNSGQKSAICSLTVAYPVSHVMLNKTVSLLSIGESMRLIATVLPESAPDKSIKWESSASNVAEVKDDGTVIAKASGRALITVITEVGSRKAVCTVRVLPSGNYITMTLQPSQERNASVSLGGSGTADIDWGDGSAIETITLSSGGTSFSHSYSDMLSRAIIISGENILYLNTNYLGNLLSLDVSANTVMANLICTYNGLTSLDVSSNTALTNLDCSNNQLTSLDVSTNIGLTTLNCNNNPLTSLNVSNTKLKSLNIRGFSVLESFVLKNNIDLTTLNCTNNSLNNLDVSGNTMLTTLDCSNNRLTSLDVSANTALTTLYCNNNQLSPKALDELFGTLPVVEKGLLEFVNNPGTVDCNASIAEDKGWTLPKYRRMFLTLQGSGTTIIELAGSGTIVIDWGDGTVTSYELPFWGSYYYDVSFSHTYNDINSRTIIIIGENIARLSCLRNRLTSLDVSKNTALTDLFCGYNQLTSLDVSKNTALTRLSCVENNLTSLDVSGCIALAFLGCNSNQLSSATLNNLFGMLHSNTISGGKSISINSNPGTKDCNRSIAELKGWTFW